MKRYAILLAVAALLLSGAAFVKAAEYLPKDRAATGNVTVGGDKEYRNLFVGGGTVVINKKILGDLFAGGGSVNVSSPVEKDLFAAGGNITVTAAVGEDARMAGGNITITAPIGGDLMVAGGTVNLSQGANVGGDLWAGSGVVNLNSNVRGSVKIAGGEILINGDIGGDVDVRANEKLVFGPQSKVSGKIVYYGPKEAIIQDGAKVGAIEFHEVKPAKGAARFSISKAIGAIFFVKLLILFITALILLKLLGRTAASIVTRAQNSPWAGLGLGFLGVIVVPIAVAVLLFTVLGSMAGLLLLVWFAFTLILSSVLGALFIGSLIEKWLFEVRTVTLTWKSAALGVAVGGIVSLIPFVGWLAVCIAYLMAFGSLLQEAKGRLEF